MPKFNPEVHVRSSIDATPSELRQHYKKYVDNKGDDGPTGNYDWKKISQPITSGELNESGGLEQLQDIYNLVSRIPELHLFRAVAKGFIPMSTVDMLIEHHKELMSKQSDEKPMAVLVLQAGKEEYEERQLKKGSQ